MYGSDEETGCVLKFIPPYSPDLNPIEESFSAGEERKNEQRQVLNMFQ